MTNRFDLTRSITIGQYIPTGSVIHRWHPSYKLFGFVLFILAAAFCNTYIGNLLILIFALLLFRISRIPIRYGLSGIRPAVPFLIVLGALQLLFYGNIASGGTVYFEYGWLVISDSSIRLVVVSAMRFIELILIASVVTLSTSMTELTHGLEQLLWPLGFVKFPVHQFSLIMMIAIRFVPTFAMEMERLMKAQASRGADFGTGKWWQILRRTKDMFPLIIPLFNSAMTRAEDLILAMESRCYTPGRRRTSYRSHPFRTVDLVFFLILLAFSLFLLFFPFPY